MHYVAALRDHSIVQSTTSRLPCCVHWCHSAMWRLWSLRLMVFNRIPRSKVNPSSNLAKSVHLNSLWMSQHIAANSFGPETLPKTCSDRIQRCFCIHTPSLFLYGMGDPRGYIHQICFCFFLFQPCRYPGGATRQRSGSQVETDENCLHSRGEVTVGAREWPMNKILLASRIEKKHTPKSNQ